MTVLSRRSWTRLAWLSLLLISFTGSLVSVQAAEPLPGIYTCVDAKGRMLTSDRFIPECSDRTQKILNPSGTVRAEIRPKLTALEQSQIDNKNKAEQAEQTRLVEDKRRDRALLIRYPNEGSHQKERAEALAHVAQVKQTAADRVTLLMAERKKLDDEMAFYNKDPAKAPQKLRRQIDEVLQAVAAQERFMTEQDAETKRVNTRFDDELLRLRHLWRQTSNRAQ